MHADAAAQATEFGRSPAHRDPFVELMHCSHHIRASLAFMNEIRECSDATPDAYCMQAIWSWWLGAPRRRWQPLKWSLLTMAYLQSVFWCPPPPPPARAHQSCLLSCLPSNSLRELALHNYTHSLELILRLSTNHEPLEPHENLMTTSIDAELNEYA